MILKKSCVPQLFLKGWITKVRRKKKIGEKVGLTVPHNQPKPQTFFPSYFWGSLFVWFPQ